MEIEYGTLVNNKLFISYEDFGNMANELLVKVQDYIKSQKGINITQVFGPPVGGVTLAAFMKHHLNLKYIQNLNRNEFIDGDILFVDDVNHTGRTIDKFIDVIKQFGFKKSICIACLHRRPNQSCIHVNTINDDIWIVYPWEAETKASEEYQEYLKIYYENLNKKKVATYK